MTPIQRLILILAAVWITVKLVLFYTGNELNYSQLVVSLNIGFTLFIIYKALQRHYLQLNNTASSEVSPLNNGTDFLIDFRVAMRAAVPYSLVIFGFLVIYYMTIDTGYVEHMVDDRIELLRQQMTNEGGYDAVMEKYKSEIALPEGEELQSEEAYFSEIRDNFMTMLNWKVFLSLIFTFFFLLNLACSAILSGLAPRVFAKRT